jgi:holo-[acyl-carrier-protein] synthase
MWAHRAAGLARCFLGHKQVAQGMMVYGIGNDICDIRRIRAGFERHGERFAQRILSAAELAAWHSRRVRWPERGVRYLATRFSAKEAFSKAIGLGMRLPMRWQLCEIANRPGGAPCVVLHGDLKHWFDARGLQAHISLSDESDYAASFCVVMRGALPAPVATAADAHRVHGL